MGRIILLLFFSLCYTVTSHATMSPQAYWISKLPNTPIPQLIKDSLVNPGGDPILKPSTTRKFIGFTDEQTALRSIIEAYIGTHDNRRSMSSTSHSDSPYDDKELESKVSNPKESLVTPKIVFFYSNKHESEEPDNNKSLVTPMIMYFYSNKQRDEPDYKEALVSRKAAYFYSDKQLKTEESSLATSRTQEKPMDKVSSQNHVTEIDERTLVFVEEDLYIGKRMNLHFTKGTKNNPFLPRQVSNKIPFSSENLQKTLNLLSINPESTKANSVSETMFICKEPDVAGLQKQCVTSLESMVDFVVTNLGENVQPLFTKIEQDFPKMEYTIENVKRLTKNDNEIVACHKMEYPYAVYFCHRSLTIRPYIVSFIGQDGTNIEAIVSCHKEASDEMKDIMKNVLKVEPGSTRVCHTFPADDNIVWVTKS